jgi:hypothetical protein
MEDQDKTYMWLAIITFVAVASAIAIALVELNDLRTEITGMSNPF